MQKIAFRATLIARNSLSFYCKILKHAFLESSAIILVNVHMLYYDSIKRKIIFDCQNDKKNEKMRIRRYEEHFEQL
jgi:hypothetical protein